MMRSFACLALCFCCLAAGAWERKGVTLSGSIQSDMLVPRHDSGTGARKTGSFLNNTYADLLMQSKYIDAGVRLEFLEYPLPGFENDFKGWGVPHFWMKGQLGKVELTAGTFYEQFGFGFRPSAERTSANILFCHCLWYEFSINFRVQR